MSTTSRQGISMDDFSSSPVKSHPGSGSGSPYRYIPAINGELSLSPRISSGPASLNSHESSLRSDVTKVDLPDYDDPEDSLNLTTVTLKKCKKQVLRPYWRLLQFIGWRGFGKESINPHHLKWRLLNLGHLLVVLALILFCHVYEAATCSWKLNLDTDVKPPPHVANDTTALPPRMPPTVSPRDIDELGHRNHSNDHSNNRSDDYPHAVMRWVPMGGGAVNKTSMPEFILQPSSPIACQHVVTTYVIPNCLHFLAYLMGLWYFRVQENEQLYALMEKVFLQATPLQGRMVSQSNMIRRMRVFLFCGGLWVILPVVLHILYAFLFGVTGLVFTPRPYMGWILFGLFILGTLMFSGVSMAVVLNYGSQCEMLTFFINGIQMRLQERSVHLKFAMKDILAVRQSLSQLNRMISRMTSLLVITFAEMIIIGVSILLKNEDDCKLMWAYRGLFPIVWLIPLLFPLVQAARCNSACSVLKRIALETRVFGYQDSSTQELDSFLNWVGQARLRAELFHVPVKTSYLIFAVVISVITFIVLVQNDVIVVGQGFI